MTIGRRIRFSCLGAKVRARVEALGTADDGTTIWAAWPRTHLSRGYAISEANRIFGFYGWIGKYFAHFFY
jgi:hypothetical protein